MENIAAKQLVEQNNKLREQLTPENKKYYEDILLYMRTFGFFHEELETEQHLMTILQDILEAQKHGESAEEYFGKNPKEIVNQLTKQFEKPSWKSIFKISGLIFLISSFFSICGGFIAPTLQVNVFVLLMDGILSIALVYGAFKLLHWSIYIKKQFPKIIKFFFVWILLMIPLGLFILINLCAPKQGIVKIGSPFDWMAILIILIMAIVYVLFKKKRDFYGGVVYIVSLGFFGLLLRIPQTKELFQGGKNPTFLVLVIILPLALFGLVNWLVFRKMKDEN
ncbi:hypothetical protein MXL46_10105 [Heyndrickxia sporothermodurans]|nr:hypothetical protein [Heyndrickxia sporothermodurans]MEB6549443.1 hypothetical protein [Heyndrickxia sporothermodurans]PTY76168.1 hypothetical protein B5V89_18810 [Heyndrickxia sporothermodurans]